MPSSTREEQQGTFLLGICLDLHGVHTGSIDRRDMPDEEMWLAIIRKALATWELGPASSEVFDEAVKNLLIATLRERGIEPPEPAVPTESS